MMAEQENPQNQISNKFQITTQIDQRYDEVNYVIKIPQQGMLKKLQIELQKYRNKHPIFMHTKIYESFHDRGKCPWIKYQYSKNQKMVIIRIKKRYYFEVLQMKQYELLKVINGFHQIWKTYSMTIDLFLKFVNQFAKIPDNIKIIDIISIDAIAITFEISYPNKKKFKFRLSFFQFRNDVNYFLKSDQSFKDQYRSSSIYSECQQIMSFCQSSNTLLNVDTQFAQSPRLNFLDDQKISELFMRRIIYKFPPFYQAFSLCRGHQDYKDCLQFNRKVFGNVFFAANRLKNFTLSFVITNPFLNQSDKNRSYFSEHSSRYYLSIMFYIEDFPQKKQDFYDISIIIYDNDKYLSSAKLNQFAQSPKEALEELIIKTHGLRRGDYKGSQALKLSVKVNDDKVITDKKQYQHQKFGRFLANLCCSISFIIDRIYFFKEVKSELIKNQKLPIQLTLPKQQFSQSNSKYKFYHTFVILLLSHLNTKDLNTFQKIIRITEKKDVKAKQDANNRNQQIQKRRDQIILDQVFINYLNQLLKNWSLRDIYQQLNLFISTILKVIYEKSTTDIMMKKHVRREKILKKVIQIITYTHQNNFKAFFKIKIYTNESTINNQQVKPSFADVTFNAYELKVGWIDRIPYGNTLLRLYDDKIEIQKGNYFNTTQVVVPDNPDLLSFEELSKVINIWNITNQNIQ